MLNRRNFFASVAGSVILLVEAFSSTTQRVSKSLATKSNDVCYVTESWLYGNREVVQTSSYGRKDGKPFFSEMPLQHAERPEGSWKTLLKQEGLSV